MTMDIEWNRRIDHWRRILPNLFFRPLVTVELSGHITDRQLSPEAASSGDFAPMPAGTRWGRVWQYAWFRGEVALPASAAGERIALRIDTGGESAIWIDGIARGAKGWSDREITLCRSAKGGERYRILIESYAGHHQPDNGGGPNPHGNVTWREPAGIIATVGTTAVGIWEEELYQLWLDLEFLAQIAAKHDPRSLRTAAIRDALKALTVVVDLELPPAALRPAARAGRALLAPLMAARNGTCAGTMHAFGHSHIDIAWLWPLAETDRKICRTFASQLALMEEYPEFRYLQSQAYLYDVAKRLHPEVHTRVYAAVERGQWIPDGAMWVEPDTNVPSGESLIRQFIHGKRFFREEFGIESRLMWLPDVFGYNGALPQIMAGCGVDYFSSMKILWTYNGGDPFPYQWFWWEGIDGTRVLTGLFHDYNAETKAETLITLWEGRLQQEGWHTTRPLAYGHGDGGGGPTRNHLENLRRASDCQGVPRCGQAPPIEVFDAMRASPAAADLPVWVGELYYQAHRGTYTTQARTKRLNRQCEISLREAECWGGFAAVVAGQTYPLALADAAWKQVLLCQFHDILPGSSITRVYVEAEATLTAAHHTAENIANAARGALVTANAQSLSIFNSLSWERPAIITLPPGVAALRGPDGAALPVQLVGDDVRLCLVPALPACGIATFAVAAAAGAGAAAQVHVTPTGLDNGVIRVVVDGVGRITSLIDIASGTEMAAGPMNELKLYQDTPGWCDAWDIDSSYKRMPIALDGEVAVTVASAGPVQGSVLVRRRVGRSQFTQEIVLAAGSRRIDFRTSVDWQEDHRLLKVNFPVTVRAEDALHEIQFGHIRRPTHASRPADAQRYEVCNQRWTALTEEGRGAAVLNDGKYGVNVEGNSINLTLLRAPLLPDPTADRGRQVFTYAFTCWNGCSLRDGGLLREAHDLNVPVAVVPGAARRTGSLVAVDASGVVIDTIKPAEDGSGEVIVRLYEAVRCATRCHLRLGFPVKSARWCDMTENDRGAAEMGPEGIAIVLRPFEIRSVRLRL